MTDSKFHQLCADLYDCTSDQINQILFEIDNIREIQTNKARRELRVRDIVSFNPTRGLYRGQTITGTVTKLNRKTATVKCDGYGNWKVPISMLSKHPGRSVIPS